ncbi:unnamed protein product [Cyclocybe aegerita]|uniref:Uncharacterized protein n=1 Tax=Cyclocybe aegerita TaxID=1973307 RepID=A0A8S0WYP6_CYCAE|nr:unnamed protein product [Cyclocybe aegerita]
MAVAERNIQVEGHQGLTALIDAEIVQKREEMCVEWDNEDFLKLKPNLIILRVSSEAQAKKELATEEEAYLKAGGVLLHETTPLGFLLMGLDLEETQPLSKRPKLPIAYSTNTVNDDNDLDDKEEDSDYDEEESEGNFEDVEEQVD